jgi:RHH-type proline utilization regulon transcriptional repressor/proline dehydrogenase/delta 1-pyrroline-5-carboxylate dehydrogenase
MAAILQMAGNRTDGFEFQRLHGMGEALHEMVRRDHGTACRIYAPVGRHRDLLAYLVRRLLENGANSSFVNQVLDTSVPAATVAGDPFSDATLGRRIRVSSDRRTCSFPSARTPAGIDLHDRTAWQKLHQVRDAFAATEWSAGPLLAVAQGGGTEEPVTNPARPGDRVGTVTLTAPEDVERAIAAARPWSGEAQARADALRRAADLYEVNAPEIFALLAREAGKSPADAMAELREAVDFLRYYAARATALAHPPRGVFACISPWNFPLAIFTGQIAAALAAGNAVLAKPAEATPLIAARATALLHDAGVPRAALQLLPGHGSVIGAAL